MISNKMPQHSEEAGPRPIWSQTHLVLLGPIGPCTNWAHSARLHSEEHGHRPFWSQTHLVLLGLIGPGTHWAI